MAKVLESNANVIIDEILETSKDESDYGSTFNNLYCRKCNEWIGRRYRTTTSELDYLRGHYTLSLGQLILFEMDIDMGDQPQSDSESATVVAKSSINDVEIVKVRK